MNLTDPTIFKSQFSTLHSAHEQYVVKVDNNRLARRNLPDVEAMKAKGSLQPGQTFISVRTIDNNVSRDVPTYLQYIKGSRRMGIFEPIQQTGLPVEPLELAVTNLLQYPGWEVDYIRWIDGGLLHGIDYVEVLHDKTKPGHVAVNHVGSDSLLYNRDGESIQQSPIVARKFSISSVDLDTYVSNGTFTNPAAIERLKEHITSREGTTIGAFLEVFKCLFKVEGVVHFVWFSRDVEEFLSTPMPFMNGQCLRQVTQQIVPGTFVIQPVTTYVDIPEKDYPYIPFSPSITEAKKISDQLGHADKTLYLQNAQSVLTTAGVNGCFLASNVQWSPAESKSYATTGVAKQLDLKIEPNKVWDQPMKPWTAPWPDATLFRALDHLDTGNASANNQIAWAVNNRQDSRKTATEVQSANQTASQINSVQVLFLSIPMRLIVAAAYGIIKSQVQKGALRLTINPALFEADYVIKSAGDIDYVQRQERIASMQQDMPIVANTAAMPLFLADYLRERYPNTAERYIQAMQQPNDTSLIQNLAQLLQQAVIDDTGNLRPEWQQHSVTLQNLNEQVRQRVTGGMGPVGTPNGNPAGAQQAQG